MLGELLPPAPTLAPVEATFDDAGLGVDVTAPTTAAPVAITPPRLPETSAPVLTTTAVGPLFEDVLLDEETVPLTPPATDFPVDATLDDELLLATPAPTLLPTELTLEDLLLEAALAAPAAALAPTLATDILSPKKMIKTKTPPFWLRPAD